MVAQDGEHEIGLIVAKVSWDAQRYEPNHKLRLDAQFRAACFLNGTSRPRRQFAAISGIHHPTVTVLTQGIAQSSDTVMVIALKEGADRRYQL
jgi:hypothetical protein